VYEPAESFVLQFHRLDRPAALVTGNATLGLLTASGPRVHIALAGGQFRFSHFLAVDFFALLFMFMVILRKLCRYLTIKLRNKN
jgi:hypothetical protein